MLVGAVLGPHRPEHAQLDGVRLSTKRVDHPPILVGRQPVQLDGRRHCHRGAQDGGRSGGGIGRSRSSSTSSAPPATASMPIRKVVSQPRGSKPVRSSAIPRPMKATQRTTSRSRGRAGRRSGRKTDAASQRSATKSITLRARPSDGANPIAANRLPPPISQPDSMVGTLKGRSPPRSAGGGAAVGSAGGGAGAVGGAAGTSAGGSGSAAASGSTAAAAASSLDVVAAGIGASGGSIGWPQTGQKRASSSD